jgi:hypothetical protein
MTDKKPVHETRETFKVDPAKVKPNDLMAIIYYVKVGLVDKNHQGMVVKDISRGLSEIRVNGSELISSSLSADFFEKEVKATMTDLLEIFTTSPNRPLTVCFLKKDGSERVLRGRWLSEVPKRGYSYCEDMDVVKTDKEKGIREVDHRNIQWLVVDGVKYVLK